nr:uncharacterized protein LOC123497017 [Aegilops tauschii subsp. strangulata]
MRRPGPGREAHRLRSASSSINKRSMCSAVVWRTAARAVASVGRRRHLQSSHRPGADPARLLHVATPSSPSQREVNLCRCCLFRQAGGARGLPSTFCSSVTIILASRDEKNVYRVQMLQKIYAAYWKSGIMLLKTSLPW